MRCGHTMPDGSACRGHARKTLDPDGVRRCIGHSVDPLALAAKAHAATHGRLSGLLQKRVPPEHRATALAGGYVPPQRPAAEGAEPIPAVDLSTAKGRVAALEHVARKLLGGQLDPQAATAMSALVRASADALPAAEPPPQTVASVVMVRRPAEAKPEPAPPTPAPKAPTVYQVSDAVAH